MNFRELINKLKSIKEMGYVKTRRAGNTGIGKTIEDLLGINENNVPGPNAAMIELKWNDPHPLDTKYLQG
ncbi:MAG: hypothetical protein DDT42_01332 [candidate division WS2 bacterium]|uniref:MvaI/BcnI restriction endonuclease domain-containing protein n=1 Tax=Psychracetigena formicireducens TaxID=2986056 RepID=A0A9E2BIV4_PSYF1|nr:hypothetical protein [Candidatus Psychracetigena formicireducens]